ncbi:MAG: sigma-54 dependent transcriptional regulator [Porticoccaceae bacterium]|nr:sigma-54-dependent Fis family transcriptional regulator [Porticoccaceae bacterium]MBT6592664.1 sigma-54-dependent Fis family transcriptional regulator [Porticoccaceae bacterium]MDG1495930.1 sigma-54 dependent transcriptional regulator [Porticoccaceae bacterium]
MTSSQKIIGQSIAIEELRTLIEMVGPSESTVLILGDSGTGKELVARALHDSSSRAGGPFIPVNCGAIPRDLLESELFGHRKGSFTGAIADRKGRFELANKGTLFLDEIGDMPIDLQVKLLRVLQERQIDPVGSLLSIPIDVRVLAATHKDIVGLMEKSLFREDLYYRLNVMPIEIKTLGERVDDVPVLFEYFAKQHIVDGKKPIRLHPTSMQLFLDYSWPGNVRELANLVDRYSSLYPGQEVDLRNVIPSMVPPGIRALASWPQANAEQRPAPKAVTDYVSSSEPLGAELFAAISGASEAESLDRINDAQLNYEVEQTILLAQGGGAFPEEGLQLKQHLLDIECNLIRHALNNAGGNVSKTARMLNLQRTTLIEKINKHGLADSA